MTTWLSYPDSTGWWFLQQETNEKVIVKVISIKGKLFADLSRVYVLVDNIDGVWSKICP